MERGYVKLWRKTLDSGLLAHPKVWQVFGYLLLNAAWKPTTYATVHGIVKLEPGQLATGRKKMAEALKMSEQNIRTALAMLANLEILTIESTSTHSTITLKNWAVYQVDQPSPNQRPTNGQPTPNQHLTTVKEGKKERIEEQPLAADAAPKGFNYFGHAIQALTDAGAVITERTGVTVGRLSTKGAKVGEDVFRRVVTLYCKDKFCLEAGLSLDGLIRSFDRLATRAKGSQQADSIEDRKLIAEIRRSMGG